MSKLSPIMAEALVAGGIPAELVQPRATRFNPDARSFEAFNLGRDEKDHTSLRDPLQSTTLKEALAEATARWAWGRGDRLGIREIGGRIDRLHIYAIRQKSQGRRVWSSNHIPTTEHDRWCEHIATIDLNIIAGIDVIGVGSERQLFEHRQAHRPDGARMERRDG